MSIPHSPLPCGGQAERRERERMEEEAFRAATLQRLAEEDRLEQLSAQRRREKTMAHRREVERLLQHRRMLFAAAQVCHAVPGTLLHLLAGAHTRHTAV